METLRHQGKVTKQSGSYWPFTTAICQRTAASNLQANQDFKAALTYMPLGVKREGYQASLLIIHTPGGFITREGNTKVFLLLFNHNIIISLGGLAKKIPLKMRIFISVLST